MEFSVKSGSPEKQRSACIVVGVYEPRRLSAVAEQLDKISEGYIQNNWIKSVKVISATCCAGVI